MLDGGPRPTLERTLNRPVLALLLLAIASVAHAQEASPTSSAGPAPAVAAPDPTAHRHLGFALRLDAGLGYSGTTGGMASSRSGASGNFGLVIGGAVAEDLILAGDLWGAGMFGGWSMMSGGGSGYGLWGTGLNVTWYLMPANVYFSLSPSVTVASSMSYRGSGSMMTGWSTAGFGFKASVGKEWWVGDHWGLGLAAQFYASWNGNGSQGSPTGTWTTLGGGLAFSATYN